MPQKKTLADEGEQIVIRANYELFVLILSVVQVVNSVLLVLFRDDPSGRIPALVNYGIAVFLILDALYRIWRARERRRFLLNFHGYLVFIGSMPFLFSGLFRLLWYRMATTRLRRADYVQMERFVVRRRAQSAILAVFLAAIIVLEASSILIIEAELGAPDATIRTANDAIWWSLVTMATVGYGDMVPVTGAGRIVALFVMVVGVSIFTVLTSFFAQTFIRPRREKDEYVHLGADPRPDSAHSSIESIKHLLDRQESEHVASMAELRERLDMLEDQLIRENKEG